MADAVPAGAPHHAAPRAQWGPRPGAAGAGGAEGVAVRRPEVACPPGGPAYNEKYVFIIGRAGSRRGVGPWVRDAGCETGQRSWASATPPTGGGASSRPGGP